MKKEILILAVVVVSIPLIAGCAGSADDGLGEDDRGGAEVRFNDDGTAVVETTDGERQAMAQSCAGSGYAGFCLSPSEYCVLGELFHCGPGFRCAHVGSPGDIQMHGGAIAKCVQSDPPKSDPHNTTSVPCGDVGPTGYCTTSGGKNGYVKCVNGVRTFYGCKTGGSCYHGTVNGAYGPHCSNGVGSSGGASSGNGGSGGACPWGLTFAGRCEGNTAVWCANGVKKTSPCSNGCTFGYHPQVCGGGQCAACGPSNGGSGSGSGSDCAGLGWKGICDGNYAVWCGNGTKQSEYCSTGCSIGNHKVCGGSACAACN